MSDHRVRMYVNGEEHERTLPARRLLSDVLRDDLGYRGVHAGCEHGVCGSCTVLVDGDAVRSCLMLGVQADGTTVETVEGLTEADGPLHPLQQAFSECHGLQCGYCTPGFLMTLKPVYDAGPTPDEDQIRDLISGNLCRCTGYQQIVEAVSLAFARRDAERQGAPAHDSSLAPRAD